MPTLSSAPAIRRALTEPTTAMNLIQKDKVAQLHILRAIAAVGVVLTHAKFVLWSGGEAYLAKFPVQTWRFLDYPLFFLDLISSLGSQRVNLFFILSGFLIKFSSRDASSLPDYLRKRLLRIYPAYLAATLLAGVILYVSVTYINASIYTEFLREYNTRLVTSYNGLTFESLLHTLSFTYVGEYFGMNAQYWSLKHEVIFYILFPFYNSFSFRNQFWLLGLCLVVVAVTGSPIAYCQLFFLVGILLYQVFERGARLPVALPTWLYCTVFLGLYLTIYLLSKYDHTGLASVLTVALAFLALEFLLTRTIRVPRVVAWFSKVSYSVYLNHMWALLLYYATLSKISGELVFYSRWPYYTGAVLAVLCSLPVYYLVEKPILIYLHRPSSNRMAGVGLFKAANIRMLAVFRSKMV
jgi:peptidoglycan/LPS O-acetylase OafA/YrhL